MLMNDFDFCLTFQLSVLNIPNFNQDDLVQAELVLVIIHNINAKRTRPGAFSNATNLRGTTSIHSERAKASNKMTKPETKDLTKNLEIINAIIFCHLFWMIGTLDFPNAQSYLSFAGTDSSFSGINATKTGITTPLSTLVAAAGKTTTNKKKSSPTSKNFPYLQAHESKQQQEINAGQNTGSSIHQSVGAGESKTPQRPIFSPFIQQPGGTFDPKAIDFSALQLPNTPPKTSRNKKHNLHKATSSASSLSSLASSLHSQIN